MTNYVRPDLSPGDLYTVGVISMTHVLEVHEACDERCVDLDIGTIVIVASEPFQPDIMEHDPEYWEIFAVGPHGLTVLSLP